MRAATVALARGAGQCHTLAPAAGTATIDHLLTSALFTMSAHCSLRGHGVEGASFNPRDGVAHDPSRV